MYPWTLDSGPWTLDPAQHELRAQDLTTLRGSRRYAATRGMSCSVVHLAGLIPGTGARAGACADARRQVPQAQRNHAGLGGGSPRCVSLHRL